jgi:hypothetical protein
MPGDGVGPRRRSCGPEAQGWVQNHVGTHALRWEGVGHPLWAAACGVFGGQGRLPQRKKKKTGGFEKMPRAVATQTSEKNTRGQTNNHAFSTRARPTYTLPLAPSPHTHPRIPTQGVHETHSASVAGGEGGVRRGGLATWRPKCGSLLQFLSGERGQPPGRSGLFVLDGCRFFFWVFGGCQSKRRVCGRGGRAYQEPGATAAPSAPRSGPSPDAGGLVAPSCLAQRSIPWRVARVSRAWETSQETPKNKVGKAGELWAMWHATIPAVPCAHGQRRADLF